MLSKYQLSVPVSSFSELRGVLEHPQHLPGHATDVDGFTRSTVLMKEAGAILPGDGVLVTRTLSVFRVRYARCMRTPLLALCLHGYNIRYPSSRLALYGRSIEPRATLHPMCPEY